MIHPRRKIQRHKAAMTLAVAMGVVVFHDSAPIVASPPLRTGLAAANESNPQQFDDALHAWDLTAAQRSVEKTQDPDQQSLRRGILAVYAASYEQAQDLLVEVLSRDQLGPDDRQRAQHYLAIAHGAQAALGDALTSTSGDGRFELVVANPADRVLAPYLFTAMSAAYEALGTDLGVRPNGPVRFEFLDDPAKLALVTPLSLNAIYTTGTVGITKYRRVMMITPRVMLHGYAWIDTAVHEYVHYLVTLRTRNKAPVWLQEGLAKLLETRWRRKTPAPPSPRTTALLHDAITEDALVTLEEMHPSIAMLPSQEKAALAYAEVETMLGLLYERSGPTALGEVMDAVAAGADAKSAMARAWGDDFEVFLTHWKTTYRRRGAMRDPVRGSSHGPLRFRDPDNDPADDNDLAGDIFSHLGGGKARQHARLGVLLTLRDKPEAAVLEYERARKVGKKHAQDPQLARRLGDLYLTLGHAAKALPLLILAGDAEPDNANIAAAEGRARLATGDRIGARIALQRALAINPFIPTLSCDLAQVAQNDEERARERSRCRISAPQQR